MIGKICTNFHIVGYGYCSSHGSGKTSMNNYRSRAEYVPIHCPRITSTGFRSRIHSVSNASLCSHYSSAAKQPVFQQTPGRVENMSSGGSRWKKGKLLGSGSYGHVYLGFNSESGEMCAMKEVALIPDDSKSKESEKQLAKEISTLSRLRHPNIVQCYGSEKVGDRLYIYLEYVSGGSINKLLQEYGELGEPAIRSYTRQILSGLAYLHSRNIVHRDIKGGNILVDPNGRVKLADFGASKHVTGEVCSLSFRGSPYWMAPEVVTNESGCNLAVDIWSLGCTVLEMATSKPPWSQYGRVAAIIKIGNSEELPEIPKHLSDDAKDFIRQCLQRNPFQRPAAANLLSHPFVSNAVPTIEKAISSLASTQAPSCNYECWNIPLSAMDILTELDVLHVYLKLLGLIMCTEEAAFEMILRGT